MSGFLDVEVVYLSLSKDLMKTDHCEFSPKSTRGETDLDRGVKSVHYFTPGLSTVSDCLRSQLLRLKDKEEYKKGGA